MTIYVIYNLLHHGRVPILPPEPTFKYIWTKQLSGNNKGCALVGTETSNDNNKSNNTTSNCIVLRSSTCHIDGQNSPKFMHKSKYTQHPSSKEPYIRTLIVSLTTITSGLLN